jgi:hypothetical protein
MQSERLEKASSCDGKGKARQPAMMIRRYSQRLLPAARFRSDFHSLGVTIVFPFFDGRREITS